MDRYRSCCKLGGPETCRKAFLGDRMLSNNSTMASGVRRWRNLTRLLVQRWTDDLYGHQQLVVGPREDEAHCPNSSPMRSSRKPVPLLSRMRWADRSSQEGIQKPPEVSGHKVS